MLLWILACSASDPDLTGTDGDTHDSASVEATADTSASPGATGPAGDSGTDVAALPLLPEALDCEVPGPSSELADGLGLVHRVVLADLTCNDGTPAVAYVRAALDPARAADWVVQLDGGAYCDGGEACAARWCGEGAYDARDMSSSWSRETRKLGGLGSAMPSNAFAGWNQVFVPYCTSDMWMGERRDVVLEAAGIRYRAHFEGALVVDALFDALEAGVSSDDGSEALPSLTDADQLLFAGASAGAMGVLVHLDAVAERLPAVSVTGLVDALWSPDPAEVAAAGAIDPGFDPAYLDAMNAYRQSLFDDVVVGLYGGRVETSCAASGIAPYLCIDPGVMQRDHVTTSFVTHHDLEDPVLAALHLERGATIEAYASAGVVGLQDLALARPELGIVGSSCRKHTVLGTTSWFQGMLVGAGGRPVSVHDVAVAQLEITPLVVIDTVGAATSECP